MAAFGIAATPNIMKDSPFASRYAMTMAQLTEPLGRWLPRNGIKRVYMLVADVGPGIDSLTSFEFDRSAMVADPIEQ